MSLEAIALVLGIGVGGVLLLVLVGVLLYKLARVVDQPPLALATLHQPGPFALQAPWVDGPVEVWIRYDVAFPFVQHFGQKPQRTFCLLLDLVADGQTFSFGHGGLHPPGLLEVEGGARYMTSFRRGNGNEPTRYAASVLVKKFPSCPRMLQGSVRVGNGTMLAQATISIRR